MSVRFVQQTWLLLVLGGISAADTVKLLNKPAFRNVTISDFRADRLVFRGVSQQYLQKPLDEVEWLAIEGRPELNSAEQAAATGQWAEAVAGYQRALASLSEPWLRELVRMRLLNACRPAGAFDLAVATYADLLGSRPALPARYRPDTPGPVGSDMNVRARTSLEQALATDFSPAASDALRNLLLELLLYDEVDPLPAGFDATASTTRPGPASRPATGRPVGILPGPDDAPAPTSAPTVRVPNRPKLASDSFVLRAAEAAASAGDYRRGARLAERGLPYVPAEERGPWRLVLGRCRLELGQAAEAAADLLTLSEADPDPGRAAQALYYVGLAHERLGRTDVASRLYAEVAQRADAPEELRTRARAALERLKP